ncbi:hypothetical protein IWW48_000581 [Coemansia sp. RSA 1200]|nr:hypothetical protein IWW48_000581 [Coemansia sp. RSA 1200]
MSTTDNSNSADPSVLLQLSSCTTIAQLERALEESSMLDPVTVLAAVPECLDSRELASLLFGADGITGRKWKQKGNEDKEEEDKWAHACVVRAEAVDRWTGRADWAVQWLEAVHGRIQIRSQIISETLYRARVLQSVIVAGTIQKQQPYQQQETVAATLADLDAMSVDELVGWTMVHTVVDNCPDLAVFSVLDTLLPSRSDDDDCAPLISLVRESWNRWWLRHMVGGSSPGLMGKLIVRYPRSFDTYTVLASIYAVGGPCSNIAGAKRALSVILADSSTMSADNDNNGMIEFPESIRQLVSGRDDTLESDKWYESLGSMTDDQLALVISKASIQVDVGETFERLGLTDIDMPTIVACQQHQHQQQRQYQEKLLVKLILSALRLGSTRVEGISLWPGLVRLHKKRVFSCIPLENIKTEYLHRLLSNEQFEQARTLIEETETVHVSDSLVRDAVCQAAREMFDNAESGNNTGNEGGVRAAARCLDVLPVSMQQQTADGGHVVRKERLLIEVAHLVWTLGSGGGGMGGLSAVFNKDNSKGNQLLPIEIRLSTDPFNLIQDILARTPGGYKKQRSVREIASKLLEISSISSCTEQKQKQQQQREALVNSDTVSWQRDLGVRNTAEALVSALLLEAATNSGDYGTAYDYVRQLINARPVLVRARGAAETYRSKQLLLHRDDDTHDPSCGLNVEVRAIECIWKGCVGLVTEWENDTTKWRSGTDIAQSVVERDRRLEVMSMALGLCPTSGIPRILRLWNRIQNTQLLADDVSEPHDLQPWSETAASSLPSQADHDGTLFASSSSSSVYQTLVGGSKSPITSTTTEEEEEDDGTANVESERAADVSELSSAVCTFDAAIIKRSLRMAGSTADRVAVLMEWLVFALTTMSKRPKHASDIAFRRRLEAYVAAQYPAEAIETLMKRVYPRLDAGNYAALEGFYSFYVRCLKSTTEGGGDEYEQVCVRLELAKKIPQECPVFVSKVKFADVVSPFTCSSESECHAMLRRNMVMIDGKRVVWPQCVGELVGLASELAKIRLLLRDGIDNGNGADKEWWTSSDGSVVASKLCRWALTDQVTNQAFNDNNRSLEHALADCLPHMVSVDDLSTVAATVAFDTNACARLDPETRHRCVTMCWDHHETDSSNSDNSNRLLMRQARIYMEYVAQVHAIRDPFMFAELPSRWAHQLDVCSSNNDLMRKDNGGRRLLSADAVAQACTNVLLQMCVDRTVASYFACQCYVFARDLVDQLLCLEETSRMKSPMPELSQLYLDAMRSVITASSSDSNDSDALGLRLAEIAACPLELCALVSADASALGVTMQVFGAAFGSALVRLAHANEATVKLDSAARLALLDVVAQHGTALTDDNADGTQLAATDGNDTNAKEKESAEFLHFCLLAERHWGVHLEQSAESRTLEGRAPAWMKLLQRTRADQQSLVVDVLVALLARWSSNSDADSVEACVAALVDWAVRNHASRVVVQSVVAHRSLFTQSAGARVIGGLVADARRIPAMVVPLATLAMLAYPGTEWAEQSMELVVYVATKVEAAKSTQAATETALAHNDGNIEGEEEEEGGSAWGLEDDLVELSDNDDDNDKVDDGSDSATIAEYLPAYAEVLHCTALHMAIVACGYVSACAACPELVDALGHTLLSAAAGHSGSADLDLELELADTLVARTQPQMMSLAPGMRSSHELLRRAIHAAYDAGMHTRAVAWIHALLVTPAVYRLGASLFATQRLIAHVDRVVLGSNDIGGRDSVALVLGAVHQDAVAVNEPDDDAWGDDDIDLDADLQDL